MIKFIINIRKGAIFRFLIILIFLNKKLTIALRNFLIKIFLAESNAHVRAQGEK